ncbi:MAG: DUF4920 domain-containing protein [Bacteroidota bacterium]|nr:DUF4920 domain-containing protein [Bacteroidota bacterium]
MNKVFSLVLICLMVFNCKKKNHARTAVDMKSVTYSLHGSSFEVDPVISTKDFSRLMTNGSDTVNMVIKGVIKEVCSKKGCWIRLPLTGEEDLMVRFKDYGFFVPTDASGEVIIKGQAFKTQISVADLRHYAQDAAATEAEIAAITEPKNAYCFIAEGVLIAQ